MEKLAEITRLSKDHFSPKTKLYCVHLLVGGTTLPEDLKKLVGRYWQEVEDQLLKLETAGKIKRVFCEGVLQESKDPLKDIGHLSEDVYRIVKKKTEEGATVTGIERADIYGPFLDWMHCLAIVRSPEAYEKVAGFYREYAEKRLKHIEALITETLKEAEAGLLIMNADDRAKLQFPPHIEVFLVTPPSFDDINRFIRDNILRQKAKEAEK